MRVPSRKMPPPKEYTDGWFGNLLAIVLGLGVFVVLPGLVWWPLAFLMPGLFLIVMLFCWRRDSRMAKIREGESICSFARSFDRRSVDPWIIRAVYDELAVAYPIRASDSCEDDLLLMDEDFDEAVLLIADRAGRSLDQSEKNPFYGKLDTIRDLVMFLQHQPKLEIR